MTIKHVIDKITRLEDEKGRTRSFRQKLITVLSDRDTGDSETIQISLSRKEAEELCNTILLNHITYTSNMIKELEDIEIPNT